MSMQVDECPCLSLSSSALPFPRIEQHTYGEAVYSPTSEIKRTEKYHKYGFPRRFRHKVQWFSLIILCPKYGRISNNIVLTAAGNELAAFLKT